MTVWFLGHSQLEAILNRVPYAALSSRIQIKEKMEPVFERDRFSQLIEQGFQDQTQDSHKNKRANTGQP